ncbi:hypothetical protein LSH36_552g01082 [Paralvinella palmiformis]|uniref:Uncharacterized protein n=1 Tax=Paralvinella palmiformis TaxID=53620 RepID=A0AAD9J7S5_9ANNE|nr:hypothetical protein LSH36_552g01082 [Paralvinella palmiformis]
MMSVLKPEFVERHISSLAQVPLEWTVGAGSFYQLNLKMCQISSLDFGFQWGRMAHRKHSILDQPKKILLLDVSLNDIVFLDHGQLAPFTQLRMLNASLNRIEKYVGIENLKLLAFLDLSHNNITKLQRLHGCITLKMLNLSVNRIEDISSMPSLVQLRELHLSNNKLKSLDGIQALPSLEELYVQRNLLTDLIPLASSFHLRILNAVDNNIASLKATMEVLQDLKKLQSVMLQGNPMEQEPNYKSRLMAATEITFLDNISIRPHPKYQVQTTHNHSMDSLKNATRQTFLEHITEKKQVMQENVQFLQKRILTLQKDFRDYEISALSDLETCLRYMDSLSLNDAQIYSSDFLNDRIPLGHHAPVSLKHHQKLNRDFGEVDPYPRPGGIISPTGNKHLRGDYKDVTDTDEVLRCVYNELARKQEDEQC